MANTQWWTYVTQVIGNDSFTEAARRARFDKSAFTRWKSGAKADPAFAVQLARAYDRNVLEALVAGDFLTPEEADLREVVAGGPTLADASDVQLADEVLRRMRAGSELMAAPISEVEERVQSNYDLAQRTSKRPTRRDRLEADD